MPSDIKLVTFSGLHTLTAEQLLAVCDGLPEADRKRALSLKSERRQRQFVMGRALLQLALLKFCHLPMVVTLQGGGKPEVEGASVSISHSGDTVAVAVCGDTENTLGVDVEVYKSRNYMRLARHYFAPEEVAELECLAGDDQKYCFFKFWVLKESLAKFTGKGLNSKLLRSPFTPFTGADSEDLAVSFYAMDSACALSITAAKNTDIDTYEAHLSAGVIELRRQARHFTRLSPPLVESFES